MKLKKHTLVSVLFIFALAAFVHAQTPVGTPPPLVIESDDVIKVESRLVIVPVSVTDTLGQPVKGLGVEHFRISENRRPQDIIEVADAENVPLEIALLFDISGSTDAMFRFEQETAARFLQDVMRPQDRATIFTIGEAPVIVQSRNVMSLSISTIRSLNPAKGQTAFFDTVSAAANYLRENAPAKSRKVVITISDGEDNSSAGIIRGNAAAYQAVTAQLNRITNETRVAELAKHRNLARVSEQSKSLKKLQDADTVFYSINPAGSSFRLNKISVSGQENMERFANETGGSAFLPKFLPIDLKSEYESEYNLQLNTQTLTTIFSQLKNELQAQYLVQYYSDGEFPDGKFVDVDLGINLKLPQGLKIRSRKGYFVKNQ